MKEKLKKLLAVISEAVNLAGADVEAGEHHIMPVYAALKNAEAATSRRIYQIEDSERDLAAAKAADKKAAALAIANAKKIEDRKKFEADAIAKAESEAKVEQERKAKHAIDSANEARARYGKKSLDELAVIAQKRKVTVPPGSNKATVVNLLVQADGLLVTEADQEAASKEGVSTAPAGELRTDGPTLEEYVAAGYKAENYPPQGYAAKASVPPVQG